MFNRVWNLSSKNEFAAKLRKKTGGAFFNFPRFAAAHCNLYLFYTFRIIKAIFYHLNLRLSQTNNSLKYILK